MTNEEFQRTILKEIRELRQDTNNKFDTLDQRLDTMDQRLGTMDQRLDTIDQRFDTVDRKLEAMDQRFEKNERKLNAVYEQTANLLEFRTEVIGKLEQISKDQKSIMGLLGEHEIAIRTLKRKSV